MTRAELRAICEGVAKDLQEKWEIGESSCFCDDWEWDSASIDEIADLLEDSISKRVIGLSD